jgi:pimeloyl-ACP methyl ester carboxylesterase
VADVAGIHGIFMNRNSRSDMMRLWRDAMVRGLHNVRYARADNLVLECAFYGHLYNDGKAAAETIYNISDLDPGLEQELFIAIGESADDDEPGPEQAEVAAKVWLPDPLQRAIRRIERHGIFDGVSSTAIRLVKQVGRYFRDPDFACRVRDELAQTMEAKPRVLVAHSLGSVIAYDWLRRQPSTSVTTLITLGSPLGFRGIRRALQPRSETSLPLWPGVSTWVNVAAVEDAVATVKKLDGLFGGHVRDRAAGNSRRTAHSALVYLQNVHTSNALKAALD